jgi:hypothetical protein
MFVVKRDGRHQKVHFDKITLRIKKLCYQLDGQCHLLHGWHRQSLELDG